MSEKKFKKPRKPDVKLLFLDRLKHESKYDRYEKALLEVMTETGSTSVLKCQHEAMRRCGMKTPDEERKLAYERGYRQEPDPILGDPVIDDQLLGSLGLPQNAPRLTELEWVSGHPFMVMAKDQSKTGKEVEIKLSHVISPPHGRAPSVTAASMLVYYASKPGELYKMLSAVAKDQAAASQGADSDKDIQAIGALIKEVRGY
jgi:hypothetical protein